ncbi:IclR family transcriptional regulator [Nocardioides alcanivorans]|uniref:IclR family transcriptional regulator n=1 Tax=Nocardioides alcanivorans TaxID=2897352 RepID=UPI001F2F1BF5|nr:IclR family transcriptional regulator [Nocardioides alcanivorans]
MTALSADHEFDDRCGSSRPTRAGVVERVTQILDVFMLGEEHVLLEDVTALSGLPRSTTFRILSQLTQLSWLEHGPRGFRLSTRAHVLGARRHDVHEDLRAATTVVLNELHAATGAVAHLGVLEGARVHYLDKIGGAAVGSVPSRVGGRIPADRTVCGKALMAQLPPEQVDDLISVNSYRQRQPDLVALHRQLSMIRNQQGVAIDSADQCAMGITAIAAPIMGPDGVAGAISLAGRNQLPLDRIAPMVTRAGRQAARLLFPDWTPPDRPSPSARRRGVLVSGW